MVKRIALGVGASLLLGIGGAQAQTAPGEAFAAAFFKEYFALQPVQATNNGVHDYDRQLPDLSPAGRAAYDAMLARYAAQGQALKTDGWSVAQRDDLEYLIGAIKGYLLDDRQVRLLDKDPNVYLGLATDSVFGLIKRDFASAPERLKSVIEREKQLPALLDAAPKEVTAPAHVYVEIAKAQIDDVVDFFRKDVPSAFTEVTDPTLRREFEAANQGTIAALGRFKAYLVATLPKASAPFALGRALFQEKLADEELVDLPVERILEVGMADLRHNQQVARDAARQIDPKKSVAQVLDEVRKDHVAPGKLLQEARDQLADLRRFVIDRKIVTVKGDEQPIVAETPPFLRATTFASMDAPAALEQHARESYYFITLPDPAWSPAKQEEYMLGYNTPLLQNVSVHEVWPGHFVQHLYDEADPGRSLVRKVLYANTTTEGWAHYTEQMMLDEGLGGNDPKQRLMQAIDALLRDARLVVGIRIHTQGMTLGEARRFFMDEGYQEPVVGEMETFRGTEDALYLYYTLGKLAILKLREDYRAKMGEHFSLLDFHDRFNQAGLIPLKLIRRELLGSDGPLL